jgi:hypothetical protein
VSEVNLNTLTEDYPDYYCLPEIVAAVRADEREACAKLSERYSLSKPTLHPDVAWDDMGKNLRMICHMTCQMLAYEIRAVGCERSPSAAPSPVDHAA